MNEVSELISILKQLSTYEGISFIRTIDSDFMEEVLIKKIADIRRRIRKNNQYELLSSHVKELPIGVVIDFLKKSKNILSSEMVESIVIELNYVQSEMIEHSNN